MGNFINILCFQGDIISLELDAIVTTMGATGFGPDNTETGGFIIDKNIFVHNMFIQCYKACYKPVVMICAMK